MRKILTIIFILVPMWFTTSATVYYSAGFNSGNLPSSITVEDYDKLPLDTAMYKHGLSEQGWKVEMVSTTGYAAVSASRLTGDGVQDNRMTTPYFIVSEPDAVLRWKGKSILKGFEDSYRVEINEQGSDIFVPLIEIDKESYDWTIRNISLEEYSGKTVCIRFVCTSKNGYMLAIDEIMAGIPEDTLLDAIDETEAIFNRTNGLTIQGSVTDFGKPVNFTSFNFYLFGNKVAEIPAEMSSGNHYEFAATADINNSILRQDYEVKGATIDGTEISIYKGSAYGYNFNRKIFVDKATGTWCNNCPEGMLISNKLRKRFGSNIFLAETHTNDRLENSEYWSNLNFYAVPYFMLNRNRQTAYSSDKNFEPGYDDNGNAEIEITDCCFNDAEANLTIRVNFGFDYNNEDDKYKLGYLITKNSYTIEERSQFRQENNCTAPRNEEFYFLPTKIPGYMIDYHDVVIEGSTAFDGIPASLPQYIVSGENLENSFTIPKPEILESFENGTITFLLIDTETGKIVNCDYRPFNDSSAGINTLADDSIDNIAIRFSNDRIISLSFPIDGENFVMNVFDIAGNKIMEESGISNSHITYPLNWKNGMGIITVNSKSCHGSLKFISK